MFKLIVFIISIAVLVDSCANQKYVDSTGLDERTMYGWKIRTGEDYSMCYGIFIGPRVFITASTCVNKDLWQNITINNSVYDSKAMKTEIHVSKDNILTGKDIIEGTTVFDRDIALVITDEPVIPLNEITPNSFVKLPKDINDVDFSKCFTQEVSKNSPIIVRKSCRLQNENLTDNSIKEFYRYYEPKEKNILGNGLFCQLKKNPDVNVLAGYVGTTFVYYYGQRYFNNPESIVNLSGLNIKLLNF